MTSDAPRPEPLPEAVPPAPPAPWTQPTVAVPQPPPATSTGLDAAPPADTLSPGMPPPAPTAGAYQPGQPLPGGVYPAVHTAPGESIPPSKAPGRKGLAALLGAGAVALGAIVIKFVLPLVAATAVSGVIGSVFGGPFDKLPSAQKQALEQRFNAAVGDSAKGLSESQAGDRVDHMITDGLPRLDDTLLVERAGLTSKLLEAADEPTCARIARATATTVPDGDAMVTAVGRMDVPSIGRWYEINVTAIEASAKGSPAVRSADQDAVNRAFADLQTKFTEAEATQIGALYNQGEVSDADACNAFRALYRHMNELPPADLAVAALYDVTP